MDVVTIAPCGITHWDNGGASARLVTTTAVPEAMRPFVRMVATLRTKPQARGGGCATRLLREMFAHADEMGFLLLIEAEAPLINPAMATEALRAWYIRLGFQPLPGQEMLFRPSPEFRQ